MTSILLWCACVLCVCVSVWQVYLKVDPLPTHTDFLISHIPRYLDTNLWGLGNHVARLIKIQLHWHLQDRMINCFALLPREISCKLSVLKICYSTESVTFNGRPAGCMWSAEVMSAARESLWKLSTCIAYPNGQLFWDMINSANIFKPREQILGALAKLWIKTNSFAPSVCPHGTTRLPLDGFSWNLIFEYFSKIFQEKSSLINIELEYNGSFTWRRIRIFIHLSFSS
jgi:hypothetical protein